MSTIYIETSIVSYLTARPSSQVIALSRQMLTQHWWEHGRLGHDLFTSDFVVEEASRGDSELAQERLRVLAELGQLEIIPESFEVAEDLLAQAILPEKARLDALHISLAAVHGIEYLLTWNCKHIANAQTLPAVYRHLEDRGLVAPFICTIEEMLGDYEPRQ